MTLISFYPLAFMYTLSPPPPLFFLRSLPPFVCKNTLSEKNLSPPKIFPSPYFSDLYFFLFFSSVRPLVVIGFLSPSLPVFLSRPHRGSGPSFCLTPFVTWKHGYSDSLPNILGISLFPLLPMKTCVSFDKKPKFLT